MNIHYYATGINVFLYRNCWCKKYKVILLINMINANVLNNTTRVDIYSLGYAGNA